jgi:flavin reductase (DIM6/NTAB) family NADH-FMN oxidoreductase RutF
MPPAATIEIPTPREYRHTIGLFATGVTVIIVGEGEQQQAMTANAVASLSLDPLLLICCIDKKANCVDQFQLDQKFCLSILNQTQADLSNYFAGIWPTETSPPNFTFTPWEGGVRLGGTLAAVGCVLQERIEGGDHWIMVGRVISLWRSETSDNGPLLFYQGGYRVLAAKTGD